MLIICGLLMKDILCVVTFTRDIWRYINLFWLNVTVIVCRFLYLVCFVHHCWQCISCQPSFSYTKLAVAFVPGIENLNSQPSRCSVSLHLHRVPILSSSLNTPFNSDTNTSSSIFSLCNTEKVDDAQLMTKQNCSLWRFSYCVTNQYTTMNIPCASVIKQ